MGAYVNDGNQQSTWEERVDSEKMSGTTSQNSWKTMGGKSLWELMAEPGTEGSPNQNHRKPMAEQS
jgi:hypothetical protein